MRVPPLIWIFTSRHSRAWCVGIESILTWSIGLGEVLAGKQKHLFVEATNNWNFGLLLRLRRLRLRSRLGLLLIRL